VAYIRAIRQPYLSTASEPRQRRHNVQPSTASTSTSLFNHVPQYLNDTQREDIDARTSTLLRDINGNISNLASAASLQASTAEKVLEKKYGRPNNVLWRWAAGDGDVPDAGKSEQQLQEEGGIRTTKLFRDGVLWYLNWGLSNAVRRQQEMVQIRLDRAQEKQKSTLYDARNKGVQLSRDPDSTMNDRVTTDEYGNIDLRGHDAYDASHETSDQSQQQLSPEQLQLFAEENSTLLNHYTDQLAQVTQAEKSLMEISSLQQTLVGHLSVQGEMIGQLVEDAANTDENVRKGNKELKRASERGSTARAVFWATCGLCGFLITWDLIF